MNTPRQAGAEPIPGYRLLDRLGSGGYGEVWRVEAPGGMHKAIKFVFGDMEGVGSDGKAAEQEYKSLNRVKTIRHPFILSIERFDVIDGHLTIIMELADKNLYDRFQECKAAGQVGIPRDELMRYMEEAAEALDLMNGHHQIQHLDIKPQNIFLVHNHIKVADFGLAKDLEGHKAELSGGLTPTYAPPETFEGWISRQSDQYSLAIVYQEMLTGQRPFNGVNIRQLIVQHMTAVPDVSGLPVGEQEVVAKALSKLPGERFTTCMDFVKALRDAEGDHQPLRSPSAKAPSPAAATPAPISTALPSPSPRVSPAPATPGAPPAKRFPALVTPGLVRPNAAPPTQVRKADDTGIIQKLSKAMPELTGDGILTPALIIGVGAQGLQMLTRLRESIRDDLGFDKLPHLKWLFLDTEERSVDMLLDKGNNLGFQRDETLAMKLQKATHYQKRDGLPPVDRWLESGMLYQIPKSQSPEGLRPLGRLALCDHYHAVCHRIRAALEAFVKPTAIQEAEQLLKRGIRSNHPRVFICTSLGGGTGSGTFLDLAYIVRRELKQLNFKVDRVVGILTRQTKPNDNTRAAISELKHYERIDVEYEGVFDTREEPIRDPGKPFDAVRLCVQESTDDRQAVRVLAHELFSPTNILSPSTTSEVELHSWSWPRNRTIQYFARSMSRELIQRWLSHEVEAKVVIPMMVDTAWRDWSLLPEAILKRLQSAVDGQAGSPIHVVNSLLVSLQAEATAGQVEIETAARIADEIQKELGRPGRDEQSYPGKLKGLYEEIVKGVVRELDARLSSACVSMIEQPGLRMIGADEATRLFRERLRQTLLPLETKMGLLEEESLIRYQQLIPQLGLLISGSMARSSQKRSALASEVVGQIDDWVKAQSLYHLYKGTVGVYRTLQNNLPELIRDIHLCRGQLGQYLNEFENPSDPSPLGERYLLPGTATKLPGFASEFLTSLQPGDWSEFESTLQAKIKHEFKGVVSVCLKSADIGPAFVKLVLRHATAFLETRVARGNVSTMLGTPERAAAFVREQVLPIFDDCDYPSVRITVPNDALAATVRATCSAIGPTIVVQPTDRMSSIVLTLEKPIEPPPPRPPVTPPSATSSTRPASGYPRVSHARVDVRWNSDVG